jgi:DNA-binding transcriptional MerR regulator
VDALTIHEAARTTGWSPRMLRYIERVGLLDAPRSDAGYRLYGAAELQRLRTLRELLQDFDIGLGEMGFAQRLRHRLRAAGLRRRLVQAQAQRPKTSPSATGCASSRTSTSACWPRPPP